MMLELGLAIGTLVTTILGFLIIIASFLFALGKRDAKIDELERRQTEDRASNKEQHQEFYRSKYQCDQTAGDVGRLEQDVREIKADIKTILERLPKKDG